MECATEAGETTSNVLEPPGYDSLSTESGVAGSSARREYERRKAKDEEKLREKWGRLGGLAVALSDERQPTKSWDRGAIGEERLGARLNALAGDGLAVLHDRRIPGSKANIDQIVITPGGIWVIDAKRYKGRPELKIEGVSFADASTSSSLAGVTARNWSMGYSNRSTSSASSSGMFRSPGRSASLKQTGP